MKKILLIIGLILLVSSVVFAANFNSTDYTMDVSVNPGWTMLPNGLQAQDNGVWQESCGIEYTYIWNPLLKEYLGYKLSNNNSVVSSGTSFNGMTDSYANYYTTNYLLGSNWVYSKEGCTFKAIWGSPTVGTWNNEIKSNVADQIKLATGWNFVTVNPYMDGLTFYEVFQNCNVTGANSWNQAVQQWNASDNTTQLAFISQQTANAAKIDRHTIGAVIAIKVANECTLNYGSTTTGPPALPD